MASIPPCRTLVANDPYQTQQISWDWLGRGWWPTSWISHPEASPGETFVAAYRCEWTLDIATILRIHVAADEQYELFLNGEKIGRGNERGDLSTWYFDTYDLNLPPGPHLLVAKVWSLGQASPRSQMSVRHGLLVSPQEETYLPLVGTGCATWTAQKLQGLSFKKPFPHDFFSIGHSLGIDAANYPEGIERGEGDHWQPVGLLHRGASAGVCNRYPAIHQLTPATLPPMREVWRKPGRVRFVSANLLRDESGGWKVKSGEDLPEELDLWQQLAEGNCPITLPPFGNRRILFDLNDYVCGYPSITTSGGSSSRIEVSWAESLYHDLPANLKGNRNEIADKYFFGVGDSFHPNGTPSRKFEGWILRAGRYLAVEIFAGQDPVTLESLRVISSSYPLELESHFTCDDCRWESLINRCHRTLQASSHDALVDGPYYEQMMWAGDGAQFTLLNYATHRDDRLVRKMIQLFDSSRLNSGLTKARHPAKDTLIIPPYSLIWISMVHDYARWRDDLAFVRARMPGVRGVLEVFLARIQQDGLVQSPPGWQFYDWCPEWSSGIPPGIEHGVSSILNWHLVLVLEQTAALEEHLGEPEQALRYRRKALQISHSLSTLCWSEERGLFRDEPQGKSFSEHAQCLALLSGSLDDGKREKLRMALPNDLNLTRCTLSFAHYLLSASCQEGLEDLFFQKLTPWFAMEEQGLKTTPEREEPTRSDCHAWSSHPLFHAFASVAGIRPASWGFGSVHIEPRPGLLREIRANMIHPQGWIRLHLRFLTNGAEGWIELPDDVEGTFVSKRWSQSLHPGKNSLGQAP